MDGPSMLTALDDATFGRLRTQLSPSAFYMRVDDNIRITSYNAAAGVQLALRSRFLGLDGGIMPSADVQTPNTDRSGKSTIVVTPEGWLLGAQVFAVAGAPLIGQCYVVVEVVQGLGSSAIALQTLAAGYVTAKQPLSWPGQPIASSLDGGGALRAIVGSAPGAGVNVTETVPTGARWELLSFESVLTTSVGVANRQHAITIDDGVNLYFIDSPAFVQAASLVGAYSYAQGQSKLAAPLNVAVPANLPANNRLLAGHRIRTSVLNLQAGDVLAAPNYLVREWLEVA